MDLQVPMNQIPAVLDIGCANVTADGRVSIDAADLVRQVGRGLIRARDPNPNLIYITGVVGVRSDGWLATIFDLDAEGHGGFSPSAGGSPTTDSGEACYVRRRMTRLRSGNGVARIAELSGEIRGIGEPRAGHSVLGAFGRCCVTPADQTVEVPCVERSLLLLAAVLPLTLDMIEAVEAADAAARRAHLSAALAPKDLHATRISHDLAVKHRPPAGDTAAG
jgi:hypothetical protein